MNRKNRSTILFWSALAIFCVASLLWAFVTRLRRVANYNLTTAFTVDNSSGYRGAPEIVFTYNVAGKRYQEEQNISMININSVNLLWKYFPLAYEAGNPGNCELLLTPDDFNNYHLNFPDSLHWILPYLKWVIVY